MDSHSDAPQSRQVREFTPGITPHWTDEERIAVLRDHGVPEHLDEVMGPFGVSPLAAKMGVQWVELTVERVVATLPVAGNEQNSGLLHGGAHLVLAETMGSIAALLHVEGKRPVVGIEIGATHHRAARSGTVTGTCTPIHLGGTLTTHQIEMADEEGRRLSTVRMTNMILGGKR